MNNLEAVLKDYRLGLVNAASVRVCLTAFEEDQALRRDRLRGHKGIRANIWAAPPQCLRYMSEQRPLVLIQAIVC
ncbi:MAG: hypothetical protein ABI671_14010 [Burkholderiales bacterium]